MAAIAEIVVVPVAAAPVRVARRAAAPLAGSMSGSSTSFTSARFAVRPTSRRGVTVMSAATDEIIEKLKGITLLEAAELVKQIEEVFGVDASAPVGGFAVAAAGAPAEAAPAVEEKTEFDVVVVDVDAAKRIGLIKVVRALTPLGLKEAKDAVTTLPSVLLAGVGKDKAEEAKKMLEEGGAKVEIK